MKGLLKFITCGSVDDGKSTLIVCRSGKGSGTGQQGRQPER